MPFAALILFFGIATAWVAHNNVSDTLDRVLIGSVRTLSLAYNSPQPDRDRLVPLAVHLLERRARPIVHYSVWRGERLIAGDASLRPPADYSATWDGIIDRHPPTVFANTYRRTQMTRGYLNSADAHDVTQAAYLRYGLLHGKLARIAMEIRRAHGDNRLIAIQIADYVDDLVAHERAAIRRSLIVGTTGFLVAGLLFWLAIQWGLRPLVALTARVDAARDAASPTVRLEAGDTIPAEIRPFADAFNGLMARLDFASQSLRQFTSNASHQMRTPLAVVRVHLDVLERYGPGSPQGRAALADISAAIDTLEQLLRQLIALARSEDQGTLPIRSFDLAEVVASVISERAAQACAEVAINYERNTEGVLHAIGDATLTAELVGNLLDNAIRYNRPHGTVSVRLTSDLDGPLVEIDDDGPGIPESEREKVWERFYRVAGPTKTPGTGLGLPIARALAQRMGATISLADGRTGRGLRVTVRFLGAAKPMTGW